MAIVIKRKENENLNAFLYRASTYIKQSGVLLAARKKRFYPPSVNERLKKESALHRLKIQKIVKKLEAMGIEPNKKNIKKALMNKK